MAEGFLGGLLGGVGDAAQGLGQGLAGLLGGGQSGGPSSSGFTPDEERRMLISTLGQLGSTLLAAGQKQSPSQRAQYLAQLGGIGSGAQNDIYKSRQGALMSAQMQEKMREMEQRRSLEQWMSDPENLKKIGITPEQAKVIGPAGVSTLLQANVQRQLTVSPAQAAITEAFQRSAPAPASAVGVPPSQAAVSGPQVSPVGTAPTEAATIAAPPAPSNPQTATAIAAYREALRDPRIIADPKKVKEISDAIIALDPTAAEYQKEYAKEVGSAQGKERASAPKALETASRMLGQIDAAINHPGLYLGTGVTALSQNIPSTAMRDFRARIAELTGGTFLQAYESLKGTGQITEVEGKKATDAISRLGDPYVATKDYRKALNDLRSVVEAGQARAGKLIGTPTAAPVREQEKPRVRRYNPETGTIE
jgi:hypothetical protein